MAKRESKKAPRPVKCWAVPDRDGEVSLWDLCHTHAEAAGKMHYLRFNDREYVHLDPIPVLITPIERKAVKRGK